MHTTGRTSEGSLIYSDTVHLNSARFGRLALLSANMRKGVLYKATAPKAMAGKSNFSIP
jgi:hypothetical protein